MGHFARASSDRRGKLVDMPVTLEQVITHVAAMEEPGTPRPRVAVLVRETIAALGLEIHERTGEVYSPAPGPSRIPQDNSRRAYRRRR